MTALGVAACGGAPVAPSRVASATIDPVNATASPSTAPDAKPSIAPTASPSPAPITLLGPIPTRTLDKATAADLQGILEAMVQQGAPDAIAAIITKDGTWAGAAGIGGPKGRKATPQDEFAIASITKTFTAALVMRFVEQGKTDLDAPLAAYLGDLAVDTNGATVRQALQMRAGIADDGPEVGTSIGADPARVWTVEETVADIGDPIGKPGASAAYSSPTYRLLSIAASRVAGTDFASALRAVLLDPVHADRILDQGPQAVTPKPWALPFGPQTGRFDAADLGAGGSISCISSATRTTGSASMASDAPSLAAWAWHLFAGDILDQGSLETMMRNGGPVLAFGLEGMPYGRGSVGTSGNKTGYGSQFAYLPEKGVVVVLFVNDPDFVIEPTVMQLVDTATRG
jgi:CubicO group peptidase (beta-lactamase class C family)